MHAPATFLEARLPFNTFFNHPSSHPYRPISTLTAVSLFGRSLTLRMPESVAPNQVQAPAQTEDPKNKPECFGVFCLTYNLKAEEETKSWKKLINIAVSGATGMISNHLLLQVGNGQKGKGGEADGHFDDSMHNKEKDRLCSIPIKFC
ncbi:hypothetical protein TB2_040112 [Malus domestica]